jgi:hypothetical protein
MSVAETKPQTREIAPISQPDAALETGYLVDTGRFEHLWRVATSFSKSSLVPDAFKRQPDNCFIACQLALRLRVDPFALMQNTYIVHGKPGFESKLVIGLLNTSSKTIGPVRYRFSGEGDAYGCEAVVIDAFTEEELVGPKVDWQLVKAEGWNKPKKSEPSKWATMPELMFRYRAAMFLARAHYPEVLLGIQTREEVEEQAIDAEIVAAPQDLDALTDKLEGETAELPTQTRSGAKVGYISSKECEEFTIALGLTESPEQVDRLLGTWNPGKSDSLQDWAGDLGRDQKSLLASRATDPPAETPQQGNGDATPEPTPDDPRPEYLDALAAATTLSAVDQVRREWRARWQTAEDMAWAKVKAEERKQQIRPKQEPDGEPRE